MCVHDHGCYAYDAIDVAYGTVIVFDAFASPPSSPSSESRRRWCDTIVTGVRSWCGWYDSTVRDDTVVATTVVDNTVVFRIM
jgi:hypothetical protein